MTETLVTNIYDDTITPVNRTRFLCFDLFINGWSSFKKDADIAIANDNKNKYII